MIRLEMCLTVGHLNEPPPSTANGKFTLFFFSVWKTQLEKRLTGNL